MEKINHIEINELICLFHDTFGFYVNTIGPWNAPKDKGPVLELSHSGMVCQCEQDWMVLVCPDDESCWKGLEEYAEKLSDITPEMMAMFLYEKGAISSDRLLVTN